MKGHEADPDPQWSLLEISRDREALADEFSEWWAGNRLDGDTLGVAFEAWLERKYEAGRPCKSAVAILRFEVERRELQGAAVDALAPYLAAVRLQPFSGDDPGTYVQGIAERVRGALAPAGAGVAGAARSMPSVEVGHETPEGGWLPYREYDPESGNIPGWAAGVHPDDPEAEREDVPGSPDSLLVRPEGAGQVQERPEETAPPGGAATSRTEPTCPCGAELGPLDLMYCSDACEARGSEVRG